MKNTTIIVLSILSFFIVSCDNEIDLLTEGADIPIVYGIVNLSDSATYIRVEKSFADPNISPSELAKDPSNLYFDKIAVQLYDENGDSLRHNLVRVDGNKEGYVRNDGPFAQAPNYLYKIINSKLGFNNKTLARLEIIDTDADTILASARTTILNEISIQYPSTGNVGGVLRLLPSETMRVRLGAGVDDSGKVSYYIGSINYQLKEYDIETGKLLKTLPQVIYTNQYSSQYDIDFPAILLYRKLAETLDENPSVYRKVDSIYVHVDCYGLELDEYKEIQLLNSGITSSSIIPVYNNIEKGQGLFSSASSDRNGPFELSFTTVDSLNKFSETRGLNIRQ